MSVNTIKHEAKEHIKDNSMIFQTYTIYLQNIFDDFMIQYIMFYII